MRYLSSFVVFRLIGKGNGQGEGGALARPAFNLDLTVVLFDEPVGDDYLLLNVLSSTDLEYLKGLCLAADGNKGLWDAAITTGLQTVMELFVENPAQPGS